MPEAATIFADARVERIATPGDHPSPTALLTACSPSATVAEVLARARAATPSTGASTPTDEELLLALLDLDRGGRVRITPCAHGTRLATYYRTRSAGGDRSLAYVATYEGNWNELRGWFDFVEADDPNAARKAFQRDRYLEYLAPHLDDLAAGARVLDAGCGVGRLTPELLRRGLHVTCADASAEALKCAVRVGLRNGATATNLQARLCDVAELGCFGDGVFDATVALELICYQDDPRVSLDELVRVTAPGGLVIVSVEGLHGSAIAAPRVGPAALAEVLDSGRLNLEDTISVRYFTKDGLANLLEQAGLVGVEVTGTQYTADGVFDSLVTDEVLGSESERAGLLALERRAAADPVLAPLARAWLAVGHVPVPGGRR